jgi:signal transduction histidine kinase
MKRWRGVLLYSYVDERLRELSHLHSTLTLHNQELTRLVNANRENLSLLTHDLKQPLASIMLVSRSFRHDGMERIKCKEAKKEKQREIYL